MAVLVALADENQEQLGQYLGIASLPGEDIDKGFMWIATGVAFGLLVRIARKRD